MQSKTKTTLPASAERQTKRFNKYGKYSSRSLDLSVPVKDFLMNPFKMNLIIQIKNSKKQFANFLSSNKYLKLIY